MKGFPNQVANIDKLTIAYWSLVQRLEAGSSVDDDAYGEALLRDQVISYRGGETIATYLVRMRERVPSGQSHRTAARGVKEFFARAGLIDESITDASSQGRALLESWDRGDQSEVVECWRAIARDIQAFDADRHTSHPYRLLLRLLAVRPGTPRALCAVVFEAQDDSKEEFNRIIQLRDLGDQGTIMEEIGVTKANWDNAKKILPSIAEQVGDVVRGKDGLYLLTSDVAAEALGDSPLAQASPPPTREVTVETIAQMKSPDDSDEGPGVGDVGSVGLVSLAEAIAKRADRSYRHNMLVQSFVRAVPGLTKLWEGTFDCLLLVNDEFMALGEVKTLDGTPFDELHQVRLAVGQLLYYESFSIPAEAQQTTESGHSMAKLAIFESQPSDAHVQWMRSIGIHAIWQSNGDFSTSRESIDVLTQLLGA